VFAVSTAEVAKFILELAKLGATLLASRDPASEIRRVRLSVEARARADGHWQAEIEARRAVPK
jgi:hypothetical protein